MRTISAFRSKLEEQRYNLPSHHTKWPSEEEMTEVLGLTSSRAVWLALESAYSYDSLERSQNLKDSLRQLKKGNISISDFTKKFKSLCDHLAAIANQFPTWTKSIVAQAETHELFISSLHGFTSSPVAFAAQHSTQPSHGRGRSGRSNYRGNSSRGHGRHPPHCQLCRLDGHYASSCLNLSNYAQKSSYAAAILAKAFHADCNINESTDWYVDSGATAQMDPSSTTLKSYDSATKAVLATGTHKDGLYVLKTGFKALTSSTASPNKASFELWHKRLGHVAFDVISSLNKCGLLHLTSILPTPSICSSCELSKQHRLPFQLNDKRSLHVLDMVHCDLRGPSPLLLLMGIVIMPYLLMITRDLLGVSKKKVFRAIKMAYERVVGNYTLHYAQLRDYCMELKERNPNTTVKIEGVIPAIVETFPSAEHMFYLKHIYDNMKLSWRGKLYKELLWKCATATTIQKFDKRMEDLKNHNIEAYEWLRKIPPQHWLGKAKSNILLNNMCEVLNRKLVDRKDKPIITSLEYIRGYLMKRIVIVQKLQDKCDGPLTPNAAKIFKLIERTAAKLKVDWNGSDLYQVTCPWGDQFVVNMSERKEMYRFKINLVNGPHAWEKSDVPTTIIPPKPYPQIGRPPKKRKKSAVELADEIMKSKKLTRTGKSVTCSLWGGDAGASSQGGGDAGAGSQHEGVGGSQTTQSSIERPHPNVLHASPSKMTKSSARRGW
nr:hypothetical protein [Tanacetum cinerariifolium]